jgi:hypothetical protein
VYEVYQPSEENRTQFDRRAFDLEHDKRWQIEQYQRTITQVCHIEKFQVRGKQTTKNHVFAAIYSYKD